MSVACLSVKTMNVGARWKNAELVANDGDDDDKQQNRKKKAATSFSTK